MEEKIIDQKFLRRLENLSLKSKRIHPGQHIGEHRSPRKGNSVEFADFRCYSAQDDFRYIDWNSYARTEKLFVKLFMEEQDLLLNIFIDNSKSMAWGEPPKNRLALQMAAALAYLSLHSCDRVSLFSCSDKLSEHLPPVRGQVGIKRCWTFLENIRPAVNTDLNHSLKDFGRYAHPGVSVLMSDLWSPSGFEEGLKYLQYLKQDVILIQILAPDELNPMLGGDLRLKDCESEEIKELTVSPMLLKAYKQRLYEFSHKTRSFCQKRGISFLQLSSEQAFDDIILRLLPAAGILSS